MLNEDTASVPYLITVLVKLMKGNGHWRMTVSAGGIRTQRIGSELRTMALLHTVHD